MNKCVIVIPAYKPSKVLIGLIEQLHFDWVEKIICVDDGSGEESEEIFAEVAHMDKVCLLKHAVNMGKGRALKTAYNHILNEFSDSQVVITVDADGQHTPEAVAKIYENSLGEQKLVLGKREFSNIESAKEIPIRSRFGNTMTRLVFAYLCNINIADTQTGLRAISMKILPEFMYVVGERYEYETNCLLWCKENGVEFKEIEIETIYENGNKSSHFNPLRDSFRIYKVIFRYMCSSLLSVLIDYSVFFILANYSSNVFLLTYTGRMCSSIANFFINKKIVFKTEGKIVFQAIKYLLLVLLSGTLSAIFVSVFQKYIVDNLLIAKILVEGALFFFNFYVQKNIVFVKEGEKR